MPALLSRRVSGVQRRGGGTNGTCTSLCVEIVDGECVCPPNEHLDCSACVICDDNCQRCNGDVFGVCEEGFSVNTNTGRCEETDTNALVISPDRAVLRCADGFFVSDGACEACTGCSTCLDEDTCLSCGTNETLVGTSCEESAERMKSCKTPIPNGAGCAIFRDGFFRNGTDCAACQPNCQRCAAEGCSLCDNSFWLNATSHDCSSLDTLTHCTTKTQQGCTLCDGGFFMKDQACVECVTATPSCTACGQVDGMYEACEDGFVLTDQRCRPFAEVDQCTEAHDSVCTRCTFWHRPNPSHTGCESHAVWWVILLAVLVVVACFIIAVVAIAQLVRWFMRLKKRQQQKRTTCVFAMKNSNISFVSLGSGVVVSQRRVECEGKLSVDRGTQLAAVCRQRWQAEAEGSAARQQPEPRKGAVPGVPGGGCS